MSSVKLYTDAELRRGVICVGCGQRKDLGTVVCWTCFKYKEPEPGVQCLKYFNGDVEEWQRMIRAARGEHV